MLEGESYLFAIAEAGTALAGFSAIALALTVNNPNWDDVKARLLVSRLVERSLMAALLALLPVLLVGLRVPGRVTWLAASGTLAIYGAVAVARTLHRRDVALALGVSRGVQGLLFALALAMIVIQVLNALGAVPGPGLGWYMLGVTWLLATAGYTFVIHIRSWLRSTGQ